MRCKADCLRIIKFAELRLADELDAAQERGEVATDATGGGRPPKTCPGNGQVSKPATFGDLSIDRCRVHEWRKLREGGGEPLVERVIQGALSEGRAPKASDIQNAVREIMVETRSMTIPGRTIITTVVPYDPEKERQKKLWQSIRYGIFSEQNTKPDPVKAATAVPADMRYSAAQQAMHLSRWIAEFANTLLEEASKTLPPVEGDARPQ